MRQRSKEEEEAAKRTWAAKMIGLLVSGEQPPSIHGRRGWNWERGTFPDDLEIDDNQYPSDDAIAQISMISDSRAIEWLRDMFPQLVQGFGTACKILVEDTEDLNRPAKRITFITGGWSGCEAVIWEMLEHPIIRRRLESEHRGGQYVFVVPAKQDNQGADYG